MTHQTSQPLNWSIIASSSLTAHGCVGLKQLYHVLGEACAGIPTVLRGAPGNVPAAIAQAPQDYAGLLHNTLSLAHANGSNRNALYTGYFFEPGQIDVLLASIATYRDQLNWILIDPVCGDNDIAYRPAAVIAKLRELVAHADLATPNVTELRLLLDLPVSHAFDTNDDWLRARSRLGCKNLIVTGIEHPETIGTRLITDSHTMEFQYPKQTSRGGTGDRFCAYLMQAHLLQGLPLERATQVAASEVALWLVQQQFAAISQSQNS